MGREGGGGEDLRQCTGKQSCDSSFFFLVSLGFNFRIACLWIYNCLLKGFRYSGNCKVKVH